MHEHEPDVQRAQHGEVDEQVGKVVVGNDGAIEGDDEGLFAEARDVGKNAAEIGNFHVGRSRGNPGLSGLFFYATSLPSNAQKNCAPDGSES